MSQERPKVLIFGSSGGIGSVVNRGLNALQKYDITRTWFNHEEPGIDKCDIRVPEDLKRIIGETEPKVILNFAAFAQEKKCRDDPAETKRTNIVAVENMVRLAQDNEIAIVYPSTVNVFGGQYGNKICDEFAQTIPKADSVYAQSKIAAENIIRGSYIPWLILRSDLVLTEMGGFAKLIKDMNLSKIGKNDIRFPVLSELYVRLIQLFIDEPLKYCGLNHLISPEFVNGISLANLAQDVISRYNLAPSSYFVPDATDDIIVPRANNKSPMPIYITPTANDNLSHFIFASTTD